MGWIGRGEGIACIAVAEVEGDSIGTRLAWQDKRASWYGTGWLAGRLANIVLDRWRVRVKPTHGGPSRIALRGARAARGGDSRTDASRPGGQVGLTFIRWGASPATGIATAAIHHPHEIALIDERGSLSFERVHRRSNALAHAFAEMGIG